MSKPTALAVEVKDNVAQVTLLGPGKGNAMGPAFWAEMPIVFGELDADPEVRAIVLNGSGNNFCYGLDLLAMGATCPLWTVARGLGAAAREVPHRGQTPAGLDHRGGRLPHPPSPPSRDGASAAAST